MQKKKKKKHRPLHAMKAQEEVEIYNTNIHRAGGNFFVLLYSVLHPYFFLLSCILPVLTT